MKTITIILGAFTLGLGLISCNKAQDPQIIHQNSATEKKEPAKDIPKKEKEEPAKDIPQKEKKKPEKPLTADMLALRKLGLKSLEIDSVALPPLPEPADPSGNIGLDTAYLRWEAKWKLPEGVELDPDKIPLVGIPPEIATRHIIWAYGSPSSIVVGNRTDIPSWSSREYDDSYTWWKDRPYIPITLNCRNEDYVTREASIFFDVNSITISRFDSLTRLHGVVPGNLALQSYTPMPYDLRHMRIAHNGVDISPLFSIRYKDYKEVVRTLNYSKWYWRDVRVSDVGMDVLDWIFDSYFHIYPLTKDYPKFTIIFILKDGTVISREVEHRV